MYNNKSYKSNLERISRLKQDLNWFIISSSDRYTEEEKEVLISAADIIDN